MKAIRDIGTSGAVKLRGWVRTIRRHKNVSFIELNDGSTFSNLQVVAAGKGPLQPIVDELSVGCSVELAGEVSVHRGNVELQLTALDVTGTSPVEEYPLQKKHHSLEFLRQHPHLRARTKTIGGALRVRHELSRGLRSFFDDRDFIGISTPVMTPSDCEGAGALFGAERADVLSGTAEPGVAAGDFFGQPMYLTVSGQMEAEMFACALGKVYTFGPTFRAEKSNTSRHLAEFWMLEPELAWTSLPDLLDLAEDAVRHSVRAAQETCPDEMAFFAERNAELEGNDDEDGNGATSSRSSAVNLSEQLALLANPGRSFARISYTEAVDVLQRDSDTTIRWGDDLSSAHERHLTETHCGGEPVFVTNWPSSIKPFYMRTNENENENEGSDHETVACFDLLVPGVGELVGGGMREERYELLQARMAREGLLAEEGSDAPKSVLDEYLELRKFGTVPHGGWGMGFERLVQYTTGLANIRDTIPVPRSAAS